MSITHVTMFHIFKSSKWTKIVLSLIIILTTLQLVRWMLLNRLDRNRPLVTDGVDLLTSQLNGNLSKLKQDVESAIRIVNNNIILDASGHFVLIYNLFEPSNFPNVGNPKKATLYSKDVALVTQSDLNKLDFLSELIKRWQGLISVAVFVPSINEIAIAIQTIAHFRNCHPIVHQYVLFHMVYPFMTGENPPETSELQQSSMNLNCTVSNNLLNYKPNYDTGSHNIPYPNNILRNVARNSVPSDYILVLDIDFLPSLNLRSMFINFCKTNNLFHYLKDKTVYVLPAFEANTSTLIPCHKEDLIKKWHKMDVRPFYWEICSKCQSPTNYSNWKNLESSPSLSIAYDVPWKDPWEPFYIGHRSIPFYDERFKQYGFNRISQVCEMHVAGYKFAVVNEAFVVHRGFKTPDSFHLSKQSDQERNRILYRHFKDELKTRYPTSIRRCY